MTTLVQGKQIGKFIVAPLFLSGLATGAAAATLNLQTAFSTAATALGVPVATTSASPPVTEAAVVNSEGYARIWLTGTQEPILDALGYNVYAVLSVVSSNLTATFYSDQNGTAVPYTFATTTNIDVEIPYNYDFADLPVDFFINAWKYQNSQANVSGVPVTEVLTVSAANTFAANTSLVTGNTGNLSYNPKAAVSLEINGVVYSSLASSPAFTVTAGTGSNGATLTWSAANAGFSLATTDNVIAKYNH